jgi:hypothetical protein
MAIDVPTVAASPPSAVSENQPATASFDARWAAWQTKGAAHDRAVRQKAAIAAPILFIVAAAVVYALLR